MQRVKEAVKIAGLKLFDPETVRDSGRRAYKMGIPKENNPRRGDERKLWEQGWSDAKDRWLELLRRHGGHMW